MYTDPPQTALTDYLKLKNPMFYGKVIELRKEVIDWLTYIPQTFPHYTKHAIDHSDEIILQISKILFDDENPEHPQVALTAVEAYILVVSAYLHDTGMVASDKEKAQILESENWARWTTGDGGGAKRWAEIEALRNNSVGSNPVVHSFVVDTQLRYLIAEFIRKDHPNRAADFMKQHEYALGRFSLNDPQLLKAIADVCIGHGLDRSELQDRERYPDRCDILGQKANIRFLAIVLRIGDLLDMRVDRACPLLMSAANPLPPSSHARWTKYRKIEQSDIAPDIIRLIAECDTQDEHRFLQDWCQWLVDEVKNARIVMTHSVRHGNWEPPVATLDGPSPTIVIRPSPSATYRPSKWTFELDKDAIFQRLIYDLYQEPSAFIRELIQNALDANRCQMYSDLREKGEELPDYPTQVEEDIRRNYPIRISLETRELLNDLSGENEKQQVLIIEDSGLGMDKEIIERYFLQVGRSYYTTEEFRRNYRFVPTSRFGLGFLSVFAVSDHVTVETYKPASQSQDGSIRLTLTGPRNYLLTEVGHRRKSGTCIEVLLREPLKPNHLTRMVSHWCRRVEFPIYVDDAGVQTTVVAERPEQFISEMPDLTEEGVKSQGKFGIRAFPVFYPGIEGELYVFTYTNDKGESWASHAWAHTTYLNSYPQAVIPSLPGQLECLHGLTVISSESGRPISARLDYRSDTSQTRLSRESILQRRRTYGGDAVPLELIPRLEQILKEHLATSPQANSEDAWQYKQRLVSYFPLPEFWTSTPSTIRIHQEHGTRLLSLQDILTFPVIRTLVPEEVLYRYVFRYPKQSRSSQRKLITRDDTPTITGDDLERLSDEHRTALFKGRSVGNVRRLNSGDLALDWSLSSERKAVILLSPGIYFMEVTELPNPTTIGIAIHKTTHDIYGHILLNINNSFVQWLLNAHDACNQGTHDLRTSQSNTLLTLLAPPLSFAGQKLRELKTYINQWRKIPNLPTELYPPEIELTEDMFTFSEADSS